MKGISHKSVIQLLQSCRVVIGYPAPGFAGGYWNMALAEPGGAQWLCIQIGLFQSRKVPYGCLSTDLYYGLFEYVSCIAGWYSMAIHYPIGPWLFKYDFSEPGIVQLTIIN